MIGLPSIICYVPPSIELLGPTTPPVFKPGSIHRIPRFGMSPSIYAGCSALALYPTTDCAPGYCFACRRLLCAPCSVFTRALSLYSGLHTVHGGLALRSSTQAEILVSSAGTAFSVVISMASNSLPLALGLRLQFKVYSGTFHCFLKTFSAGLESGAHPNILTLKWRFISHCVE